MWDLFPLNVNFPSPELIFPIIPTPPECSVMSASMYCIYVEQGENTEFMKKVE